MNKDKYGKDYTEMIENIRKIALITFVSFYMMTLVACGNSENMSEQVKNVQRKIDLALEKESTYSDWASISYQYENDLLNEEQKQIKGFDKIQKKMEEYEKQVLNDKYIQCAGKAGEALKVAEGFPEGFLIYHYEYSEGNISINHVSEDVSYIYMSYMYDDLPTGEFRHAMCTIAKKDGLYRVFTEKDKDYSYCYEMFKLGDDMKEVDDEEVNLCRKHSYALLDEDTTKFFN